MHSVDMRAASFKFKHSLSSVDVDARCVYVSTYLILNM